MAIGVKTNSSSSLCIKNSVQWNTIQYNNLLTRCAKDLGVIFDDQLTFSDHTVKTVSSCMSSLTRMFPALKNSLLIQNSMLFSGLSS